MPLEILSNRYVSRQMADDVSFSEILKFLVRYSCPPNTAFTTTQRRTNKLDVLSDCIRPGKIGLKRNMNDFIITC